MSRSPRITAVWVAVSLTLLAAGAALIKARSYDLWWHLAAGEWIVTNGAIPREDPFSFTSQGSPWVDHGWLFQILVYSLYRWAGPAGLTLLKTACALAVAWIGYVALRSRGMPPWIAMAASALAVVGLRERLGERPEAISLPLAAMAAWLLLAPLADGSIRRLASVAALSAIWANLHAAALLAPVMAAACAVSSVVAATIGILSGSSRRHPVTWFAISALPVAAAALMLNPYGPRIYLVPSGIADALAPANLANPEWAAPTPSRFPLFFLLAAGAVALSIHALRRRGGAAAPAVGLTVLAAGLGLTSVRHIGLFFAVLPVAAAFLLPEAGPAREEGTVRRHAGLAGLVGGFGACLAAGLWMSLLPPPGAVSGVGVQPDRFPEAAAVFIDERMPDARLYNDVAFGGYLIWRGYPGRRVFIDGRNEVHSGLLKEISESLDDGRRWQDLLTRHGVEGAVVSYRDDVVKVRDAVTGRAGESTFSESHFPQHLWALVHWDDVAMVFARREGRFSSLIGEAEYVRLRPEAFRAGLASRAPATGDPAAAAEVARKLAETPGCRLAGQMATVYGVARSRPAP